MPTHVASHNHEKPVSATRVLGVDFGGHLNNGVTLTGTPTVTVTPAGPTVSGEAVLAASRVINNRTVPIGEGVVFTVAGGTAGTQYRLKITVTASNGETLIGACYLDVAAD